MAQHTMSSDTSKQHRLLNVYDVPPDAERVCGTVGILCRWKKSVYKLIWRHMLFFIGSYISVSLLYNYALSDEAREHFDVITEYCWTNMRSFHWVIILGFFTNTSLHRLFYVQMNVPGTARITTVYLMSLKQGLPEGPHLVEQYCRWTVLAWILTFRMISKPLKKKYPDLSSLENADILTPCERELLEQEETRKYAQLPHPLVVIEWMLLLIKETAAYSRFHEKSGVYKNSEAVMLFKKKCSNVLKFQGQNIPFAIIQAVVIAVYCSGALILISRNIPNFSKSDFTKDVVIAYVPIMPTIQFFIYIAWLSFGRAAVNPFGEDDTDVNIPELAEQHRNSAQRLMKLYSENLETVFPELPHKSHNVFLHEDGTTQTETIF